MIQLFYWKLYHITSILEGRTISDEVEPVLLVEILSSTNIICFCFQYNNIDHYAINS